MYKQSFEQWNLIVTSQNCIALEADSSLGVVIIAFFMYQIHCTP
jgi:hypothetical protein